MENGAQSSFAVQGATSMAALMHDKKGGVKRMN